MATEVLFIEYPKCSTCKKAKKWLDDHGVSYIDRNIVEDNPQAAEIADWQERSGLPVRRFFNTSGMKYRELGVKAKPDGKLVKRPIVVAGDTVLVGFREAAWEAALL